MKQFFILFIALLAMIGMAGATYTAIASVTDLGGLNSDEMAPASWTTLAANGSINYLLWPAGYDLILCLNASAITNSTLDYFSIMAGDNPPAFRSGIGNLTYSSLGAEDYWFGPLESARFINETGYLQLSSGYITGTVAIIKVKE